MTIIDKMKEHCNVQNTRKTPAQATASAKRSDIRFDMKQQHDLAYMHPFTWIGRFAPVPTDTRQATHLLLIMSASLMLKPAAIRPPTVKKIPEVSIGETFPQQRLRYQTLISCLALPSPEFQSSSMMIQWLA